MSCGRNRRGGREMGTHVGRNGVKARAYLARSAVWCARRLDIFRSGVWRGLRGITIRPSVPVSMDRSARKREFKEKKKRMGMRTLSSRPPAGEIP